MQAQSTTNEIVHINPNRDIFFMVIHNSHEITQRHWHDELEINYITKGTVFVDVGGHEDRLDAGDVVVVNSGVIHSANGSPGNDAILVQIPMEFLSRYIPDIDHCYFDLDTHNQDPHHKTKLMQLKTVMENMAVVEDVQPDGGALRFSSLLFELLFELYHNFRVPVAPVGVLDARSMLDVMRPVIGYTRDHYMEPIAIDDVAALAHLQPEYFCRKFKALMGQTYLEYLNDVRLSFVYEDLIHTNQKLYNILEKHGFTDYKLFRRIFREKFGCTPGELRKKNKQRQKSGDGTFTSYTGRYSIQPQMYSEEGKRELTGMREL